MNKFVKYTSRIILGLFTIFWGLATYYAYTPDESYHHCEAGQNDGNPICVALIALASLLVFCFVWYITKDKSIAYPNENSTGEDLPDLFKSYVEFDNYMSKLKWEKIENKDEIASVSGFYLYKCRGDNHHFYEFHELEKGERLWKYYLDYHFDGWAAVIPECYHIVENNEGEFMMKNWSWADNSMSFAPQSEEPIRLANGKLY